MIIRPTSICCIGIEAGSDARTERDRHGQRKARPAGGAGDARTVPRELLDGDDQGQTGSFGFSFNFTLFSTTTTITTTIGTIQKFSAAHFS